MISLTNEITIYFSALTKEPQINLNNKKNSLLPLNFETRAIELPRICVYTLKLV